MSRAVGTSASAIERRLVLLARLSATHRSDAPCVAMTAHEIEARLLECSELSRVCAALALRPRDP